MSDASQKRQRESRLEADARDKSGESDRQPDTKAEQNRPGQLDGQDRGEGVKVIHLPSLIADEFGTTIVSVMDEIAFGEIYIDDEPWDGDQLHLPYDSIAGKTITVKGRVRTYRVDYKDTK